MQIDFFRIWGQFSRFLSGYYSFTWNFHAVFQKRDNLDIRAHVFSVIHIVSVNWLYKSVECSFTLLQFANLLNRNCIPWQYQWHDHISIFWPKVVEMVEEIVESSKIGVDIKHLLGFKSQTCCKYLYDRLCCSTKILNICMTHFLEVFLFLKTFWDAYLLAQYIVDSIANLKPGFASSCLNNLTQ